MKQTGIIAVTAISFCIISTGLAESVRPLMSKENRFPDAQQLELGTIFSYTEFDENSFVGRKLKRHEGEMNLYARFGLLSNLSIYTKMPLKFINSDRIGKHNGIGDIKAGLELLAYEHTYDYPYFIPYFELSFPTGNENKMLGSGDFGGAFGTAIGTTVYDVYHYVLDGRFDYSQTGNTSEGLLMLSAAFIWDLSEQFSLLLEGRITEKPEGSDDVPVYFNGGMCYEATENLSIYWYGGASSNSEQNGSGSMKLAYRF